MAISFFVVLWVNNCVCFWTHPDDCWQSSPLSTCVERGKHIADVQGVSTGFIYFHLHCCCLGLTPDCRKLQSPPLYKNREGEAPQGQGVSTGLFSILSSLLLFWDSPPCQQADIPPLYTCREGEAHRRCAGGEYGFINSKHILLFSPVPLIYPLLLHS